MGTLKESKEGRDRNRKEPSTAGAATKTRNISRKGAKAAKKLNFRTWRAWRPFDVAQDRLGASKSPFWIATATGKFA
jgi:hypothetical protein